MPRCPSILLYLMPNPKPMTSASGSIEHSVVSIQKRRGAGFAVTVFPRAEAKMACEKMVGIRYRYTHNAPIQPLPANSIHANRRRQA